MRAAWSLREFLVEGGDGGELLERLRLERLLHLGEAEGVVLLLVLGRARRAALDQVVLLVLVGVGAASSTSSSSLKEGPAVFSLISPSSSSSALLDLLGGRALGEHRVEIEDLAQLHRRRC